jgi:hypothetical protein
MGWAVYRIDKDKNDIMRTRRITPRGLKRDAMDFLKIRGLTSSNKEPLVWTRDPVRVRGIPETPQDHLLQAEAERMATQP